MLKTIRNILLLCTAVVLTACNAEEMINRDYLCRFSLDTQLHPGSNLEAAVGGVGTFVWVTYSRENGIGCFHVHSYNSSEEETILLTTAEENMISYNLGAYNGIFIGSTNFNGPWAYDRQCPNCLSETGLMKYPLTWVNKQPMKVECANCKRVYSLETGASETGGLRLMTYYVSYYVASGMSSKITAYN